MGFCSGAALEVFARLWPVQWQAGLTSILDRLITERVTSCTMEFKLIYYASSDRDISSPQRGGMLGQRQRRLEETHKGANEQRNEPLGAAGFSKRRSIGYYICPRLERSVILSKSLYDGLAGKLGETSSGLNRKQREWLKSADPVSGRPAAAEKPRTRTGMEKRLPFSPCRVVVVSVSWAN